MKRTITYRYFAECSIEVEIPVYYSNDYKNWTDVEWEYITSKANDKVKDKKPDWEHSILREPKIEEKEN